MNSGKSSSAPANAPRVLENWVRRAEAARASDLHLQMTGKTAQVIFRCDGVMTPVGSLEEGLAERVFGRIKFLARLKTYQEQLPQDGRIDAQDISAPCDLRVSTYPTVTGEKIVLRLFDPARALTLDEIGFPSAAREVLARCLSGNTGMLLLTGPAGSGKTTTIYACLRDLAERGGRHIITVEDPVEQIIPGIMQTEIQEARGLDYACAARHLLRQDPQVLVIGEIRDEQTARIALRAALTGHLVIATLHAGSCRGVFDRLLAMHTEPHIVFPAVELVLNQRLIRRLCPSCQGRGCEACLQTGYRGRVPVVEWLKLDDGLRQRLGADGTGIIDLPEPLVVMARRLQAAGVTDEREICRMIDS